MTFLFLSLLLSGKNAALTVGGIIVLAKVWDKDKARNNRPLGR